MKTVEELETQAKLLEALIGKVKPIETVDIKDCRGIHKCA